MFYAITHDHMSNLKLILICGTIYLLLFDIVATLYLDNNPYALQNKVTSFVIFLALAGLPPLPMFMSKVWSM